MDPKGKYVKDAAYAAVLAWKNALNIDDQGQGPDKQGDNDKDLKPQPIPEYQKKMIAAFDTYIKYVPDAPELVTIKYRKARIYYDYNHFDEAVAAVPGHRREALQPRAGRVYSANLLLDSLNVAGQDQGGRRAGSTSSWRCPTLMKNAEFAKNMVNLKVDSLVIEAKQYEEQGNYKECGRSMLAAAESMPDHPKHAERLYDAGRCFQNARLIGRAVSRAQRADQDPPDRSAGPEGAVPDRHRLPPARLLQRGGQALRAVRHQVPGREGGGRRARQRLQVPGRPAASTTRPSRT